MLSRARGTNSDCGDVDGAGDLYRRMSTQQLNARRGVYTFLPYLAFTTPLHINIHIIIHRYHMDLQAFALGKTQNILRVPYILTAPCFSYPAHLV